MSKNEQGIAAVVGLLLIVLVLGGVGFAGYKVMQARQDKPATTADTATKANAKTWQTGDYAVEGTYADASVVQTGDGQWRMYYGIQPEVQGNQLQVYSATSTDGKTWTQESGTRKTMATFPNVVKTTDGKYRMYFQQAGAIKSAISSDGLSFTDEAGSRMTTANNVGLTFDNVAAPSVFLQDDGTWMMVYRGTVNTRYAADTPNATTQLLMWATSTDGLTFTQKGIAVDSRNSTLRGQLDGPDIQKWDDGKLHVFATTYAGVYEFVFDGSSFSDGTLAYALASDLPASQNGPTAPADVAPPGDPSLAKIDGTWYMYYGGPRTKNGLWYAALK